MKARELMVGDYVSVILGGTQIKLAAVHLHKVAYHAYPDKLTWVRESLLRPIPLTPEILEQNGFEEYDDMHFRWEYCEGIYINADFIAEEPSVIIHNRSYFCYPQCFYVHQLQQALRLCRINKEIVWMDL